MKEKRTFVVNTITLISIIILYYIVGAKSLFLYVLSFSLYNIFTACTGHISFTRVSLNNKDHLKLFKTSILTIVLLSLGLLLLGIFLSDVMEILLNIHNTLFVFVMMGLSVMARLLIKLCSEYFCDSKYRNLLDIYTIFDNILLLIIALITFRAFRMSNHIATALLYLSKIIPMLIILGYIFIKNKDKFMHKSSIKDNYLIYKKEFKNIFTSDYYKSIISIVKYSYFYISIIVLYRVLSTIYGYKITDVEKIITFVYFYAMAIINYLVYLAKMVNSKIPKDVSVTSRIYNNFKIMLSISIILGFISPLLCRVIFNDASLAVYFTMVNFTSIFILLYDITYENIKNKKIIYTSLIIGLISKIILLLPLVGAFYRMGYNLVYGDIFSTIIGLFVSVIINYIFIKMRDKEQKSYFERLLDILYENILLSIILVVFQFIIPMDTKNYFKSFGLIIVYIIISIAFIKLKNMKRG